MGTDPADRADADRADADRAAHGRPDDASAATAVAADGAAHREAIAAAIASELDARDGSRAFSADELRTAARGVVAAVGPEAATEIRAWAWELLELLGADEDGFVDRFAAMVAWRMVERFDARRGRSGGRAGDEGASRRGDVDEPGDGGSAPSPEAPSS